MCYKQMVYIPLQTVAISAELIVYGAPKLVAEGACDGEGYGVGKIGFDTQMRFKLRAA